MSKIKEKVIHPDLERLAALAHEQWSGWMQYMFSKCNPGPIGSDVTIPYEYASRWQRQMETEYADLPENEKESNRIEAQRVIDLLNQVTSRIGKEETNG